MILLFSLPIIGFTSPAIATELPSWHYEAVGTPTAWEKATGEGVTVAVIDSGVDASHPALQHAVLPGNSYVDAADRRETSRLGHYDPVGHGTAVAGLIAAAADSPAPGIAPDAAILPIRVLDDNNRYHDATIVAAAIEWAVDQGADIINLSLGGSHSTYAVATALEYAAENDVLVVACTGNARPEEESDIWYPGRDPLTIAVTGIGPDGDRWPSAITGENVTLAAPSAHLRALAPQSGYRSVTGTSFSTALVSGAAAVLWSAFPEASALEIRQMLVDTASPSKPGTGAGVLDLAAALMLEPSAVEPIVPRPLTHLTLGTVELVASALSAALLIAVAVWLKPKRSPVLLAQRPGPEDRDTEKAGRGFSRRLAG